MSSMSLTSDQIIDITSYINAYRAKHSAPPLKWNSTIASFSQQWSDYLLSKNLFQHSGSQLYGENLAYFEGYGSDLINLIKMSVDAWYNEVSLYDFNKPGFSAATGHFTCLVWLASKEYGIAISFDPKTTKAIITMNTTPPGNVIGQFQQNVLPIGGTVPTPTPTPVPIPVPVPTPTPTPTPIPVPVPTPIPVPVPIPTPVPVPTQYPIQVQQVIAMLHNIVYWVQTKRPRSYLIYQLQTAMTYIAAINLPITNNLLYLLQMAIQSIQNKKPSSAVIMMIQNAIIALHPYLSTLTPP